MQVIGKYNEREADNFPSMLKELTLALEKGPADILGEVFMEMNLGSKETGQFFTPFHIAELMAEMSFKKADFEDNKICSMNEPAAGAGAIIIALAKVVNKHGFNYQKQLQVIAQDLDYKAVYMCYVQLSLLGIPAKVVQGNTLTDPVTEHLKKYD